MKNKILIYIFAALLLSPACSKLNELSTRVDGLEERIAALEEWQVKTNKNIESLRAVLNVIEGYDYITSVEGVYDQGELIGYKIDYKHFGTTYIYNGEDGKDGQDGKDAHNPIIGVAKDSDALLYWTIDSQWLLDADGHKVKAVGTDGQTPADGKTPQLKIDGGYWYVSYDGKNWTKAGQATGTPGGDSIFSSVTQEAGQLVLKLHNGETYYVPIGAQLEIVFDSPSTVIVKPGEAREISYTITSSTGDADIEVLCGGNVKARVIPSSALNGKIEITTGSTLEQGYDKVVVLVTNGEKVIMKSLSFEEAGLVVKDGSTKDIPAEGGKAQLVFLTNVDFDVEIPSSADWITLESTKTMMEHSATINVSANPGSKRSAVVTVRSKVGNLCLEYVINQASEYSTLALNVISTTFTVPSFQAVGGELQGLVEWGDGTTAPWVAGLSKTYTDGAKSHNVKINMKNSGKFSFEKLTGISSVDMSSY